MRGEGRRLHEEQNRGSTSLATSLAVHQKNRLHHFHTMAKNLQHVLSAAGLGQKESQLYLAGLRLGSAPASSYAKVTGMNRITAYNTLEAMVHEGLFMTIRDANAKHYRPADPEQLAVEVRKHADAVERALPELRSLRGAGFRSPHVRFFEGWDGVRRVYEDTLTAHTEILNFANSALVRRHWPEYDVEYVAERVKRGIYLRGIAPGDAVGKRVHGEDKGKKREIRLVPSRHFDFTNEINIYDHKVAICSYPGKKGEETFGMIIESREVAETQKQIFEMAWRWAGGVKKRTEYV